MSGEAARADLSHLSVDERTCVAVALTQGARWTAAGECWLHGRPIVCVSVGGTPYVTVLLPHYLNDPAAWGPLMVAEQIAAVPGDDGWSCYARSVGPPQVAATIGKAICLAVLAKHGVEVPQ